MVTTWDKTLVCDLDQTLCTLKTEGQTYLDVMPLSGAIESLQKLKEQGWTIIIHTARGMGSRKGDVERVKKEVLPDIEKWLDKWQVPYDSVVMGKPLGAVYLDDKAMRFDNNWPDILKQLL